MNQLGESLTTLFLVIGANIGLEITRMVYPRPICQFFFWPSLLALGYGIFRLIKVTWLDRDREGR